MIPANLAFQCAAIFNPSKTNNRKSSSLPVITGARVRGGVTVTATRPSYARFSAIVLVPRVQKPAHDGRASSPSHHTCPKAIDGNGARSNLNFFPMRNPAHLYRQLEAAQGISPSP